MADVIPILAPPSAAAIRAELIELVERDLLGPAGGENEVLGHHEAPRDRYLVGLIAPRGRAVEPEADEPLRAAEESGEDGVPEVEPAQESLFPSSVGMSFRVEGGCEYLRVSATWGRYERVANPEGEGRVWQRQSAGGELMLELSRGLPAPSTANDLLGKGSAALLPATRPFAKNAQRTLVALVRGRAGGEDQGARGFQS